MDSEVAVLEFGDGPNQSLVSGSILHDVLELCRRLDAAIQCRPRDFQTNPEA